MSCTERAQKEHFLHIGKELMVSTMAAFSRGARVDLEFSPPIRVRVIAGDDQRDDGLVLNAGLVLYRDGRYATWGVLPLEDRRELSGLISPFVEIFYMPDHTAAEPDAQGSKWEVAQGTTVTCAECAQSFIVDNPKEPGACPHCSWTVNILIPCPVVGCDNVMNHVCTYCGDDGLRCKGNPLFINDDADDNPLELFQVNAFLSKATEVLGIKPEDGDPLYELLAAMVSKDDLTEVRAHLSEVRDNLGYLMRSIGWDTDEKSN